MSKASLESFDLASIGLSAIGKISELWRSGRSDSLIDYTRTVRVEPIVIIDTDCVFEDITPEIMQAFQTLFTGYYLQAVAINQTVGKVDVRRELDKFNPKRDPLDNAIGTGEWLMARESFDFGLPFYGDQRRAAMEAIPEDEKDAAWRRQQREAEDRNRREENRDYRDHAKAHREANQFRIDNENVRIKREMDQAEAQRRADEVERNYKLNSEKFGHAKAMDMARNELQEKGLELNEKNYNLNRDRWEAEQSAKGFKVGRDTFSTIKELSNLSVGKLISVEITDGLHKAEIPISIRLLASSMPTNNLIHTLSTGLEDTSFIERWHRWRAGGIDFWRDLVLCNDLIDQHRKNLMSDKDGTYTNILSRKRGNQLSTLLSGNPSVATASNMVLMSSQTAISLEAAIGGKLSNPKVREKLFKETSLMIMAVVDKSWGRVTFYHRGIPEHTEMSARDLKMSSKGNGPDVSDVLKAYQLGNSPSL